MTHRFAFSMRALIATTILFFMSAVGAQTPSPLRVVVPAIPATLDPHLASSPVELAVASELFAGLVIRDASGKIVPGVAESWEISPDGLVYTFTIQRRARWSDGRRMDAKDFAAGLIRALDPETTAPYAGDLFAIQGAEDVHAGHLAPSELGVSALPFRKLRITLHRPSASFLDVLSRPVAAPVPRHAMRRTEQLWATPGEMVSNGAFTATASSGSLALSKNPRFFDADATAVDRIEFITAENTSETARLIGNGAADLTLGFPFEVDDGAPSDSVRLENGEGIYFVAINVRQNPLNERGVRHALGMTVNREAISRQMKLAGISPAYKVVPPSILDETLSPRAPYAILRTDMRVPIAEVLLAESKISKKNPKHFTLIYPHGGVHTAIAQLLAEAWLPLGIQVKTEEKSSAEYDQMLSSGMFDMALATWPTESSSPAGYLEPFGGNAGPRNITGYADPDFDQNFITADSVMDDAARAPFIAAAEGVLIQDQVILPVFFFTPNHTVAEHVQGWVANPSGVHPLRYLSLQSAEHPHSVQ
jgi:oligopeptide transport system substrate-binding protein